MHYLGLFLALSHLGPMDRLLGASTIVTQLGSVPPLIVVLNTLVQCICIRNHASDPIHGLYTLSRDVTPIIPSHRLGIEGFGPEVVATKAPENEASVAGKVQITSLKILTNLPQRPLWPRAS